MPQRGTPGGGSVASRYAIVTKSEELLGGDQTRTGVGVGLPVAANRGPVNLWQELMEVELFPEGLQSACRGESPGTGSFPQAHPRHDFRWEWGGGQHRFPRSLRFLRSLQTTLLPQCYTSSSGPLDVVTSSS